MSTITVRKLYDGTMSLSDTQTRCQFDQQGGQQLAEIKPDIADLKAINAKVPVNYAGYELKLAGGLLTQLLFVEGVVATNPFGTKMFDCTIYVAGKETKVSVFGK